jgi:hypothetical protein
MLPVTGLLPQANQQVSGLCPVLEPHRLDGLTLAQLGDLIVTGDEDPSGEALLGT